MIRFYAPDIEVTRTLPESDSGHCIRVLRHSAGDCIEVVDGYGNLLRCEIVDPNPKKVVVEIVEKIQLPKEWDVNITLAVAPTKNMDRMEWLAEKAVEMGIDEFITLRCDRSERKVVKRDRLEKIMVSAMKQSLKARLPKLSDMLTFKEFMSRDTSDTKVMGYCDSSFPLKTLAREYKSGNDVIILIGPEGDFSPEEVKLAVSSGYVPMTFGPTRLRTETAALAAVETIHVINQIG
jgi:16S rRNA (uracil1498-N3)-methyltransferase